MARRETSEDRKVAPKCIGRETQSENFRAQQLEAGSRSFERS